MNDKLFVIAIGGTGMRCLESFVHLCAIGMFDGQDIDILTIDTDNGNGNKDRAEKLINLYNKIKSSEGNKGGSANKQTFFSAKLNLYRFFTDYSGNRLTYRNLANITEGDDDNEDLAGLFLDKESVQSFALDHGYRAQTHLGSMLMYHGIIEAAKNAYVKDDQALQQEKDLREFVTKLMDEGSGARVFLFGSVFGGTGASSIPVVPDALAEAVNILSGGNNALDAERVKFGASLLTDYFKFPAPSGAGMNTEKVIANSSNFALNSQAALDFYRKDPTVKKFYRRLYHVGWPGAMRKDISDGRLLTGGSDQKNPCHVVELMCAMGAYDFFTREELPREQNSENMPCLYRTIACNDDGKFFRFTAESFVDKGIKSKLLLEKMSQFFSLANVVLASEGCAYGKKSTANEKYGLLGFIDRLRGINESYNDLDAIDLAEIEEYLKMFAFYINSDKNELVPGWIYQIRNSIEGGKFIFTSGIFIQSPNQLGNLGKNPGSLFDTAESEKNWKSGGFLSSQYDTFIKGLKEKTTVSEEQGASTLKEQFIAFLYNAIRRAHNFQN